MKAVHSFELFCIAHWVTQCQLSLIMHENDRLTM